MGSSSAVGIESCWVKLRWTDRGNGNDAESPEPRGENVTDLETGGKGNRENILE